MRLTEEQCDYLKSLGHDIVHVIDVGAGGLTNSLIRELDLALSQQELVKVRVRFGNRQRREQLLEHLAPASDALLVQRAGNAALLYRPAPDPIIKLPAARTGT